MSRQVFPAGDGGVEVIELTPEEGQALFEQRCREHLGVGAEEFCRRWAAGEYEDDDRAGYVAMLLPFWREEG